MRFLIIPATLLLLCETPNFGTALKLSKYLINYFKLMENYNV